MSNRNFYLLLLSAFVVCLFNLRLDVMEVDAAQYAEMSWEMMKNKTFLQPTCLGNAYLDKPPLLFWLSSASMFVLGVNNFAYKLPSLLFALLAVYSTYRLAKIYYEEKVARIAAVMLTTSQAMFLMTNDVRTDTLLMGAVIFSIWQWAVFWGTSKTRNLLFGSIGIALALLAKGPIGLFAVVTSLIPHLIWKKKWNQLFDARFFLSFFVIAVLLLPMCIGLYQQHGMNGLKFYFWTQSFGRITGESEWNNHPDTFFLVHSTAWQILPWALYFFAGWFTSVVNLFRVRFVSCSRKEIVTISGLTLVLLALSLSKYQLPHYVFVFFPLAAIIAAKYFSELSPVSKSGKIFSVIQIIILVALFLVAGFLQFAFKQGDMLSLSCILLLFAFCLLFFFRFNDLLVTSSATIISFNLLFSAFYFPEMLKYQPENDFGRYAKQHSLNENLVCYQLPGTFSLAFYAQNQSIPNLWSVEEVKSLLIQRKALLIYTSENGMKNIHTENIPYIIIAERKWFRISHLNFNFLNPSTRDSVCEKVFLVEINRNHRLSSKYSL